MATAQKPRNPKKAQTPQAPERTSDIYQDVTQAVIHALEEGTVIWQCSWYPQGLPQNITTHKTYRGWNVFWLNFHCRLKGYSSPYYLTYKQAQELGGTIRSGEKGTRITYWAELKGKTTSPVPPCQDNTEERTLRRVPKTYTVFNIDQTEGLPLAVLPANQQTRAEKIEACETVVRDMPHRPAIQTCGNEAYYDILSDTVVVPGLEKSTSGEGYYCTLFHELGHATGHKSRLNRPGLVGSDGFGKENYAKEELTAELTAAFLCAVTGITRNTLPNSAAYIASWLEALKNDKRLILTAAGQAQQAADYILHTI